MAISEQSKIHVIRKPYFQHEEICTDLQKCIKKQHVLNMEKGYVSRSMFVPCLVPASMGNHKVFFGFFISSQF
jgi:hypothetical protein